MDGFGVVSILFIFSVHLVKNTSTAMQYLESHPLLILDLYGGGGGGGGLTQMYSENLIFGNS